MDGHTGLESAYPVRPGGDAAQVKADRKADTRRKLLVGAIYLKKAQLDEAFKAQHEALLKAELTRPGDRELFGLAEAGQ